MISRKLARAVALGAAVVVATGGLASAALAADPIDVTPPNDWVPWDYPFEARVNDEALYFATGVHVSDDPRALVLVWRRTLHDTADGLVVGNAHVIGTARQTGWSGPMVLTSDGAAVWSDGQTGRLMMNDAADRTTPITAAASNVPSSLSGAWYVVDGNLRSIASPATEVILPDLSGEEWPTWANYSFSVANAAVSDTAVAWIEEAIGYSDAGVARSGRRVYVQLLDDAGLIGAPRLLAEDLDEEPAAPYEVQVSDEFVAWQSSNATGRTVVSVPLSDLAATPVEVSIAGSPWSTDLGGSRMALDSTQESGYRITILDLATGESTPVGTQYAMLRDLHDDVLTFGDATATVDTLSLLPLAGAPEITVLHRFPDVRGDSPFVAHIDRLAIDGITTGYPDGTFRPMAAVTREAMAAFLYRVAGEPDFTAPATSPFADITPGHPFFDAICWLAAEGISTGWVTPEGTREFRPGQPVSREAMAAFLHRFAGEPVATVPASSPFTDVSTGHPFYTAITWLAGEGISTGWATPTGAQFRPGQSIERQAMAAFLVRFSAATRPA